MQIPPSTLRGRPAITRYEHDEQGRVIRAITTTWTSEDRALMTAWRMYKATLCPGCGQPKATAWHPDNDGWWEEGESFTCHPCTLQRGHKNEHGQIEPVEYSDVVDTRDYDARPLPPLTPPPSAA